MSFETLGLFILAESLMSLTPGPAVLLVLGLSVRHGFRIGFGATLGIIATNGFYFTLSALGVGAAILASATLFAVIKWAGALYLAWIGLGMLRPLLRRFQHGLRRDGPLIDVPVAARQAGRFEPDARKSFARGVVLQASNPKNIAFFVAILPQFVTPGENVAGQLIVLGIASVLLELPILVFYGMASSRSARWMTARTVDWIEGAAGGLLIAMGAALAFYRRTT